MNERNTMIMENFKSQEMKFEEFQDGVERNHVMKSHMEVIRLMDQDENNRRLAAIKASKDQRQTEKQLSDQMRVQALMEERARFKNKQENIRGNLEGERQEIISRLNRNTGDVMAMSMIQQSQYQNKSQMSQVDNNA